MKVEMLMPQMGESITEATISKWRKRPGESIGKDEIILEISTDKVDSEIPAPAAGVLAEVLFKEGDVVPVKTRIAVIDTNGTAAAPKAAPAAAPAQTPAAPANDEPDTGGRYYSPLVRSLAEKYSVSESELASIRGSGQGGRVNKEDLLNYVEHRGPNGKPSAAGVSELPQAAAPQRAPVIETRQPAPPPMKYDESAVEVVPFDRMREAIAEHMVRSKHTSPHVYSVQEVDCSKIAKYRAKFKDQFKSKEGFGLSYTPFFLEAAVKALQQFPYVNASVDGKKIIVHKHVNLGCAVALGNTGLIVPVIKRAENLNFLGIARALNDLANRARSKKLSPDDVMGGTFSVTNPGVFGTMIGTPIINQPQAAILCLGAITKRVVVVDDMMAIREMCFLTLSYDHRIIDGSLGGQFLAAVREYVENWDLERPLY